MKTKHIPGPWTIGEMIKIPYGMEYALAVPINASHTQISTVILEAPYVDDITDMNEGFANARLIAAAPELLQALERCLSDDAGDLDPETVHLAYEAINKAKGDV